MVEQQATRTFVLLLVEQPGRREDTYRYVSVLPADGLVPFFPFLFLPACHSIHLPFMLSIQSSSIPDSYTPMMIIIIIPIIW